MLQKLTSNPVKLFQIDSFGGFLSAFFLAVIPSIIKNIYGLPYTVLFFLATVAGIYGIYSACCYFFARKWKPYLKLIAIANMGYCLVTMVVLFLYRHELTALGIAYFLVELLLIMILVFTELKAISKYTPQ
jgi:hypothetical protein